MDEITSLNYKYKIMMIIISLKFKNIIRVDF